MIVQPLLRGVPQVALTVPNLEDAVGFYGTKLGLPLLFQTPHMAMFACGATRVLVATKEANPTGQPTAVYFAVEDAAKAQATLQAQGVRFQGEPHVVGQFQNRDVWLATFTDPGGTLHHLVAETPVKAAAPATGPPR